MNSPRQDTAPGAVGTQVATRKIWLPRLLYDCLPYFYLTAGFSALFATLYINQWFWVLPHYLMFSAGCIHLGIYIIRRRHARPESRPEVTVDQTEAAPG